MTVSLVAAVARGGVIGHDGGIPWRLPDDVARFKELTTGHAVVMGRKTWDSLPERFRPLPDRRNVVVTRDPGWQAEGAERAASVEDALALLESQPEIFVIGGGEIYAAAFPYADELLLTESILDAIASLSFLTHFSSIAKGVIDLRDLLYFGVLIVVWLAANAIVLDMKKAD